MGIKNKGRKEMKNSFPSRILFCLFLMTEMKNGSAGIRVISSSNYDEREEKTGWYCPHDGFSWSWRQLLPTTSSMQHTHTHRENQRIFDCVRLTLSCLASFILFHKLPSYYQFHRGNFYLLFVLASDQNRTCSLYIIVLDIFTVLCVGGDHPKIRHGTRISVPCFVFIYVSRLYRHRSLYWIIAYAHMKP